MIKEQYKKTNWKKEQAFVCALLVNKYIIYWNTTNRQNAIINNVIYAVLKVVQIINHMQNYLPFAIKMLFAILWIYANAKWDSKPQRKPKRK